ncbi:MAG: hypothetical protein ACOYL6_05355 [Bacteriovoracaceae bacterium]
MIIDNATRWQQTPEAKIMADISSASSKPIQAQKESDYKQQVLENRRIREQHMQEVAGTKEKNEMLTDTMKKDYEVKFSQEKSDLEAKLGEVRERYADRISKENERFESELSDLKRSHIDQVTELKTTQFKDIDRMQRQHKDYISNARTKFEAEKVKNKA